jgi:hypothetical protein
MTAPSNAEILDYLDCGFDTLDIARMCGVPEHVIYNRIAWLTNGHDAPAYRASAKTVRRENRSARKVMEGA